MGTCRAAATCTSLERAVSELVLDTQGLRRWAEFDETRKFRFLLGREWDNRLPRACFIGANPSDADEERDDMTATKYVGFGKRNRFGSYVALNVSPAIGTDPDEAAAIVVPPEFRFRGWGETLSQVDTVIVAWGDAALKFGPHVVAGAQSFIWLAGSRRVFCLGRTKSGQPRHASRLGYDTPLEPYEIAT